MRQAFLEDASRCDRSLEQAHSWEPDRSGLDLRPCPYAAEIRALRHAVDDIDCDYAVLLGPQACEQSLGALSGRGRFAIQFVCMTGGGVLMAAGLVASLSLGLFDRAGFAVIGSGAAAMGVVLCAAAFSIGRVGERQSEPVMEPLSRPALSM